MKNSIIRLIARNPTDRGSLTVTALWKSNSSSISQILDRQSKPSPFSEGSLSLAVSTTVVNLSGEIYIRLRTTRYQGQQPPETQLTQAKKEDRAKVSRENAET